MEIEDLYGKVQNLFQAGQLEKAVALAKERSTKSRNEARFHLRWADLLEELGLFDEVILELNFAIRDDPESQDTYRRLSEIYLDNGYPGKAARCYWSIIKQNPAKATNYKQLGQILEEEGDYEKALKVYNVGYEKTGDEVFKALIRSLNFLGSEETLEVAVETTDHIIPAQHNLVTFTTLFAGREGVYARQWVSPTGETGYTPVHEPLTLKATENHILGNMTAGIYPIRLDNTVNFIAFDLDLPKFVVNKTITRESLWKKAIEKVHRVACELVDLGAAHDIPIYIEDSGFKGRHCWIFLETPVPAGVARKFGDILAGQLTGKTPEISIEIFPKQGRVRQGNLGNLIKLPLGFHKKTGRRGIFVRSDGQPHDNQLELLESVVKATRRSIYALVQRFSQQPVKPPETTPPWEEDKKEWKPVPKVAEVYDLELDPQFQYLLMKCPVLKCIVEKVNRESSLTKEETLVLIHTVGHLDHGPSAVNDLFQRCVNSDPSLFLKSKLRGNPISCPKIRARIPHITSTVACNCRFDTSINLYPTPLIHVYSIPSEKRALPVGLTVNSMQFQNLLQEYLASRKQAREINLLLGRYEKQLHDFFEQAGINAVQTPMGELKKIQKEEGGISFSLELNQTAPP